MNVNNNVNLSNSLSNTPLVNDIDKGNGFAKLLENGIEALNNEQLISEAHKKDIASGEVKDLQKAIIEIDRASLSMSLAGEVKNKILSAYKEMMNTQI